MYPSCKNGPDTSMSRPMWCPISALSAHSPDLPSRPDFPATVSVLARGQGGLPLIFRRGRRLKLILRRFEFPDSATAHQSSSVLRFDSSSIDLLQFQCVAPCRRFGGVVKNAPRRAPEHLMIEHPAMERGQVS